MELATLNLDTYRIVKLLQAKGYSEQQAEGFLEAMEEIRLTGVATKSDIESLQGKLIALEKSLRGIEGTLRKEMGDLAAELRKEIAESSAELRKEIAESSAELRKEIAESSAELRKEIGEGRADTRSLRDEVKDFKADIYKFIFVNSLAVVGLTVTLLKLMP